MFAVRQAGKDKYGKANPPLMINSIVVNPCLLDVELSTEKGGADRWAKGVGNGAASCIVGGPHQNVEEPPAGSVVVQNRTAFSPAREEALMPVAIETLQSIEGADAVVYISSPNGRVLAHCSLWWSETPLLDGERTGFVGHFQAPSPSYASHLLGLAFFQLASQGCSIAIGPINGSTWRSYRFVNDTGAEAPFFMEPENPATYPAFFVENGFNVLCNYYSTVTDGLKVDEDVKGQYQARLAKEGINIREFNVALIDEELSALYDISARSFASNFLYQEISKPEFMALYKPLVPILDPRLILIAEVESRPVGFILLVPDLNEARKSTDGKAKTVIVKTAARLPEDNFAGLGSLLLLEAQARAHGLGYERAIHALMHEKNASLTICHRYGRVMRQYSLYHRYL